MSLLPDLGLEKSRPILLYDFFTKKKQLPGL